MARTVHTIYPEIGITVTKRWKDSNGKWRRKNKRFSQTVNPWNRTIDGEIKTVEMIREQIHKQSQEWLAAPEEETNGR